MVTITDPVTRRTRKGHALIFTAVYSRHMFVWLTYTQTLAAVIAGCDPSESSQGIGRDGTTGVALFLR